MKRKFLCSLFCVLMALCLSVMAVGCAKNSSDVTGEYEDGQYYSSKSSDTINYSSDSSSSIPQEWKTSEKTEDVDDGRKLIKTFNIYAETKGFDEGLTFLDSTLTQFGGYYQSKKVDSNVTRYYYSVYSSDSSATRYAYFVFRVPADKADAFVAALKGKFNVVRSEETTTDVTLSYSDVEGHLSALHAQETRLIEMMASAETLADLITLDDKLADVRYEIESYEKQLRNYDNQIEYVTIDMTLQEVKEWTVSETTFWEELVAAVQTALEDFGEGCKDFVIWFVSAQPTFIVLGVIGLAIFFIVRGIVKGAKKRKEAKKVEESK